MRIIEVIGCQPVDGLVKRPGIRTGKAGYQVRIHQIGPEIADVMLGLQAVAVIQQQPQFIIVEEGIIRTHFHWLFPIDFLVHLAFITKAVQRVTAADKEQVIFTHEQIGECLQGNIAFPVLLHNVDQVVRQIQHNRRSRDIVAFSDRVEQLSRLSLLRLITGKDIRRHGIRQVHHRHQRGDARLLREGIKIAEINLVIFRADDHFAAVIRPGHSIAVFQRSTDLIVYGPDSCMFGQHFAEKGHILGKCHIRDIASIHEIDIRFSFLPALCPKVRYIRNGFLFDCCCGFPEMSLLRCFTNSGIRNEHQHCGHHCRDLFQQRLLIHGHPPCTFMIFLKKAAFLIRLKGHLPQIVSRSSGFTYIPFPSSTEKVSAYSGII